MQNETPASLPIGTHVSAKYKGAFCEAKVRSVVKQVKCRVTFKFGYGSTTLSDEYIRCSSPLAVGSSVTARHPDKQEYLEATINKIQDQSSYTVVFDDGDITTLRRNALCIKSGKHYNASESLDNLPLTHPEHFSTPVAGSRRKKGAAGGGGGRDSGDEYESSSDNDDTSYTSSSYVANVGRVVWAENTDKKCKAREAWFPALIVAPAASGTVKIDIKEEYLIRSFKDGRYYTVTKKDTTRFHRDAIRKPENAHMRETLEKAVTYLEKDELPPLWDREVLFSMGDGSTTESSESEEIDDDLEEDEESPEAKDHLVAELYKHMEDRGSPINKTPSIDGRDVDLGRLFRMVMKLGGHNRVTNNSLWRKVAQKLGFDTMWCINQVRVHYKRYLQSFEELYRTLGVTMVNHPARSSLGATSSALAVGGRVQIRGKHRSGTSKDKDKDSANSDADSEKQGEETPEILKASTRADHDKKKVSEESKATTESSDKKKGKVVSTPAAKDKKPPKSEATPDAAPPTVTPTATPSVAPLATPPSKKGRPSAGGDDVKMTTRPRRDSTSSLAAAMQVKAQKDTIGEGGNLRKANPVVRMDRDQNAENELRKIQAARSPKANKTSEEPALGTPVTSATPPATTPSVATAATAASPPSSSTVSNGGKSGNGSDTSAAGDSDRSRAKKKPGKRSVVKPEEEEAPSAPSSSSTGPAAPTGDAEPETEKQHLAPHVDVDVGDRIKVFYKQNTIYEAKVIRSQVRPGEKWPRFLVHYQGWNARYDEWIKRFRIAENLSWSKDRVRQPKPPEGAMDSPGAETPSSQAQQQPPQQQQQQQQQPQQQPQMQRESPRTTRKDLIRKERSEKLVARSRGRPTDASATGSSPRATTPSSRGGSRTASPSSLKRQSSRSSTRKESEESEEENEDSEDSSRKSRRLRTSNPPPAATADHRKMSAAGSSRKRLAAKEDSEAEDVDVEKDYEATTAPAHKPKRSRMKTSQTPDDSGSEEKGSVSSSSADTPSRSVTTRGTARQPLTPKASEKRAKAKDEDEEDPYAFKEPDHDATGTPKKTTAATTTTAPNPQTPSTRKQQQQQQQQQHAAAADIPEDATQAKELSRQSTSKRKLSSRLRGESDSADSGSDESGSKKSRTASASVSKSGSSENESLEVKSESCEEKASAKEDMLPKGEIETCQVSTKSDEVKTEPDASKAAEKQPEAGKPVLQLTKKQQELFPFLSAIRTTTVADVSGAGGRTASKAATPTATPSTTTGATAKQVEAAKSDADEDDRKPPERSAKKRKDPRKPKSSEIAESESESEQNSDAESSKAKSAVKSKTPAVSARQKGARSGGDLTGGDEDGQKRTAASADKRGKAKKEDADDLDLACGETIPGSPVHPSSSSASTVDQRPASGQKGSSGGATRLEMPFASVPESVHGPAPTSDSATAVASGRGPNAVPATLPPRRAYDSKLRDDATDCSSVSQSPRESRPEGSKSPVDSSEVDMDSLSGRKAESEDSRLDVESSLTEQRKPASVRKSAQQNSFSSAASAAGKRKRKSTREAALAASGRGGRGGGRGRHGSGRGNDEAEGLEERKNAMLLALDNDELVALTQKSPKSKYNFFVPLECGLDSTERISRIQTSLEDLRKTYLSLKSELAVIERRRKKMRRKERERGTGSSSAAASPAVESAA